jgi:dTDP-4-dehydrorhamnose 3,5-epimerase
MRRLELEEVIELRPGRMFDDRGFFSEVWREEWLAKAGVGHQFVQDNHSYSKSRGVLRGMHYQLPPAAQAKLVRVSRGAIFDVAVDIRRQSPTYGRWAGVRLSAEEWNQLYVPEGFAHGFLALEDETEVQYKLSAGYAPALERSIRFDDPAIGIEWPIAAQQIIISDRDAAAPLLSDINTGL